MRPRPLPPTAARVVRLPQLSRAWQPVAYPLALVILGVAAYANSFGAPFMLDDKPQIVRNMALVRPPISLSQLLTADRPFVSASLALNYALGGLNVFGYHALNLAAHILCALTVYGLARHTLRLPVLHERYGAAADTLALVAASLFLVHPIQTESVTYVIQRAETFAALAVLSGLWLAATAQRAAEDATARRWSPLHLVALVAIGLLGMLSKESAVILPALFALYDWCFIAQGRLRPMLRRWPLYVTLLLVVTGGMAWRWWRATRSGALALGGVDLSGFDLSGIDLSGADAAAPAPAGTHGLLTPWQYLRWQFGVWLYYLRLVVVPNRLCFDCGYLGPWPVQSSLLGGSVWLPFLVLAAIAGAAWVARRQYPLVTFCVFASAVALAPTSSIVPLTDVYVEHRLYLPIAFLALLGVMVVFSASAETVQRGWLSSRAAHALGLTASVAIVVTLAVLTLARNRLYADPQQLLQISVALAPQSTRTQYNLGNEYVRHTQREQAIKQFKEVIRLNHNYVDAYVNLGQQYLELNRNQEAIAALEQARTRAPATAIVQRNLSVAYLRVNRVDEAITAAQRATTLEPLNARAYKLLGRAYQRAGRSDEALKALSTARQLDPHDTEVRGRIRDLGGRPE